MTNQDAARRAAGDIASYLKNRETARTAEVPRPAILDEVEPRDQSRRPGWRALREQTEREYLDKLLSKGSLSVEERAFIGKHLFAHFRNE